jgi:hypothetical protein
LTGTPSASTITRNKPPPLSVAAKVSGSEPVHVVSVRAPPPADWTMGANRSRIVTVDVVIHRSEKSGTGEASRVRHDVAVPCRHTNDTRTHVASLKLRVSVVLKASIRPSPGVVDASIRAWIAPQSPAA